MPAPGDSLRQGDVVQADRPADEGLSDLYFIATGDCDVANDKHFGKLLALPLVPLADYYLRFRVPKLLTELRVGKNGLEDQSVFVLNEALRLAGENALPYKDGLAWMERSGPATICEHLRPQVGPDSLKQFGQLEQRLICMCTALNSFPSNGSIAAAATFVKQAKDAVGERLKNGPKAYFEKDLQNFLKSSPKDIFLLSEISLDHDPGFVVALRFPEQINSADISLDDSTSSRRLRRISRIVYPYSTGILHQFANLFTTVGFPDEQKDSLTIAAELIVQAWEWEDAPS